MESLSELDNLECAPKIAEHFTNVSCEYSPVENNQLVRKTKSTLPIDILDKLRMECSVHLVAPLSDIYNDSLTQSVYPTLWKYEWVTPAPKITNPMDILYK